MFLKIAFGWLAFELKPAETKQFREPHILRIPMSPVFRSGVACSAGLVLVLYSACSLDASLRLQAVTGAKVAVPLGKAQSARLV